MIRFGMADVTRTNPYIVVQLAAADFKEGEICAKKQTGGAQLQPCDEVHFNQAVPQLYRPNSTSGWEAITSSDPKTGRKWIGKLDEPKAATLLKLASLPVEPWRTRFDRTWNNQWRFITGKAKMTSPRQDVNRVLRQLGVNSK
jgi:hypothetical protein